MTKLHQHVIQHTKDRQAGEAFGRWLLTEYLLQLHDTRVGPDAVNCLRVLEVGTLLEDLCVWAIGVKIRNSHLVGDCELRDV